MLLGPIRSRIEFPGGGGETVAAPALRGNKSSRILPRPGGVSLRRCWRACGGGAPSVELLYRRIVPVRLCLWRATELRGFCFLDAVQGGGSVDGWWQGQTRSSRDGSGRLRRALGLDQRSSGCNPGRWATGDAFFSSVWVRVSCDSFSKPCGDGTPLGLGMAANRRWAPVASSGGRRWRCRRS